MYEKLPEILEDKFWDSLDVVIPYTEESEPFHKKPFHGSVVDIPYVYVFVLVMDIYVFLFNLHNLLHFVIVIFSYVFFPFHWMCSPRELSCVACKIYCLFGFIVIGLVIALHV